MALQVWFPLSKNMTNAGLTEIETTNNGGTLTVGGKFGNCYTTTADGQGITMVDFMDTLKAYTAYTMCAWIYMSASATNHSTTILSSGNWNATDGNLCFGLYSYYDNGYTRLLFPNRSSWSNNITLPNKLVLNTWYHVLVEYDGNETRAYINGEYIGKSSLGGICQSPTSGDLKIGSATYTSIFSLNGRINDVRIYDNVLTEKSIKELYWAKLLEFTPKWLDTNKMFDASGFVFPLTPHNMTIEGSDAKFNGSSSYVGFNGLSMSGGSLSVWFSMAAKPSSQEMIYYDPVAKMALGLLSDGNLLTAANGTKKSRYLSTGITWGKMNHVLAVWNSSKQPTALYVNGVAAGTGATTNWSTGGTAAAIGRRLGVANYDDYFNGVINEVKVFGSQLTAADAKMLYDGGTKDFSNVDDIILFQDSAVRDICVQTWGSGGVLTKSQAAAVTNIGNVFQGNIDIVSFTEFGKYFTGTTTIPQNAFSGCTSLTDIIIPSSVTSYGQTIFNGCNNIKELVLNKNTSVNQISSCLTGGTLIINGNLTGVAYHTITAKNTIVKGNLISNQTMFVFDVTYCESIRVFGNISISGGRPLTYSNSNVKKLRFFELMGTYNGNKLNQGNTANHFTSNAVVHLGYNGIGATPSQVMANYASKIYVGDGSSASADNAVLSQYIANSEWSQYASKLDIWSNYQGEYK